MKLAYANAANVSQVIANYVKKVGNCTGGCTLAIPDLVIKTNLGTKDTLARWNDWFQRNYDSLKAELSKHGVRLHQQNGNLILDI